MADEQEKAYEVKDKRRVNPDGTLKEDAEQTQTEAAPETDKAAEEPRAEAPGGGEKEAPEMPPPNVYATLGFIVGLMAEQAWQFMGLHLPPGQKEPANDLVQAKVAIDTIVFISDKLHPHVSEEERKALRSLISDLQINYVQRNQ